MCAIYGCDVLATAEAIDPISRALRAAAISLRRAVIRRFAGTTAAATFGAWVSMDILLSFYREALPPAFPDNAAYTGTGDQTMPRELDWTDVLEIGIRLQEMFPDTDPYSVRFTDMHKWIIQLPGFIGDPTKSNEGILEAIQTAWHEEYTDAKDA